MRKEILAATAMVTFGFGMAHAESLESLKANTEAFGAAAVAAVAGMKAPRFVLAGKVGIPLYAKDAFKGLKACDVVDAYNKPVDGHGLGALPANVSVAIDLLDPCLDAVSRRYGFQRYGVKVSADRIFVHAEANGSFQPGAMMEAIGISISPEKLPIGNSVKQDLLFALNSRGGRLFGYQAQVLSPNDAAPHTPLPGQQ